MKIFKKTIVVLSVMVFICGISYIAISNKIIERPEGIPIAVALICLCVAVILMAKMLFSAIDAPPQQEPEVWD